MAIQTYKCRQCNRPHEQYFRTQAERSEAGTKPESCPSCKGELKRTIGLPSPADFKSRRIQQIVKRNDYGEITKTI